MAQRGRRYRVTAAYQVSNATWESSGTGSWRLPGIEAPLRCAMCSMPWVPSRGTAYTTVMTVMARLADQGVLVRELAGKTFVYRAACSRAEFRAGISGAIVTDLVADFGDVRAGPVCGCAGASGPCAAGAPSRVLW